MDTNHPTNVAPALFVGCRWDRRARAVQLQGCPSPSEPPGNCSTAARRTHQSQKPTKHHSPWLFLSAALGRANTRVLLCARWHRHGGDGVGELLGTNMASQHGAAGLPEVCHNRESLGTLSPMVFISWVTGSSFAAQ